MKIYLAADHNGAHLRDQVRQTLEAAHHEVISEESTVIDPNDDFPQLAGRAVAQLLAEPQADARGIFICGSGQGMCMAANRFKSIRASLCWSVDEARAARNDDDSNVLCLSSRYTDWPTTQAIITTWLATPFAGAPRFVRRLKELDQL